MNAQDLSKKLYHLDPVNTCCEENECYDEYDAFSEAVVEAIEAGLDPVDAVRETFVDYFGFEPMSNVIDRIVALI